jgi:6-phosphogluconolactonase
MMLIHRGSEILGSGWSLSVRLAGAFLLAASTQVFGNPAVKGKYLVFIGTYTQQNSKGIYAYRFDEATGKVTALGLAAESVNPSFLAVDPSERFLYADNETDNYEGRKTGAVSAFSINRSTGKLTFLNQVASRGTAPCYVSLDHTGKYVLVANYGSGSVAVFPVLADGSLGKASAFDQHTGHSVNPKRQEGPHAHSISLSPDNRFALAADLGLDELLVYRFDPISGSLQPNDPPFAKVAPGAGPRHFAFSPNGKFVYVISEMGSTITAFTYDANRGVLHEFQAISTLPGGYHGESTGAEVEVHPSGKFLYASNRGDDSIAVFRVNARSGKLTPIESISTQGKTPRNFAIDPTGSYLFAANQDSDTVVVFQIHQETGRLTPTGQVLKISSPVCVVFVPAE